MLSVVMALCLWKFPIWNDVRSLSQIVLIRILWNLFTLFSTMMSSSSWIMVHFAFSSYGPLFMKTHRFKWCLLSKSNTFDHNFIKLGHIVKYHDVFFKFDNGPYSTMLSAVMGLCLFKFTLLNDVRSLRWIVLIRILWNLVTLFSTKMSSLSLKMVYMAPCFKELLPLVYEKLSVETTSAL